MRRFKFPSAFITGTDTGIGKTFVTAALIYELNRRGVRAGAMKPVQSGGGRFSRAQLRGDADLLARASAFQGDPELINPYDFSESLSPHLVSRISGNEIRMEKLLASFAKMKASYDTLLVEGAGGLMTPISDGVFMVSLAKLFNLPIIIVAGSRLGTINHTLMTVKTAEKFDVPVIGIIINKISKNPDLAEETNPGEILRLTGISLMGLVPDIGIIRSREQFLEKASKAGKYLYLDNIL